VPSSEAGGKILLHPKKTYFQTGSFQPFSNRR